MFAKYNRTRRFYPHLEPIFAGIYKRFILKSGADVDQNHTGDLLITNYVFLNISFIKLLFTLRKNNHFPLIAFY